MRGTEAGRQTKTQRLGSKGLRQKQRVKDGDREGISKGETGPGCGVGAVTKRPGEKTTRMQRKRGEWGEEKGGGHLRK